MAISKILYMKDCGKAFHGKHLKLAIQYITDKEKTQEQRLVAGVNCQPEYAFEQMKRTKKEFGKVDKRQGYHLIISFDEGEVSPDTAFEIAEKFVKEYLSDRYEAVYAVHDNTDHIHAHIIFNSVSFLDGKKYRYEKGDWAKYIQPITNRLCQEYGISTIEIESEKVKSFENEHRNERERKWNVPARDASESAEPYEEEEKIFKTMIPKGKREELTRIQKVYYARLYRSGVIKKRSYSHSWKLKEEIRKFQKLQQQYLFLVEHDIQSVDHLEKEKEVLTDRKKEISREKSRVYRERSKCKELFLTLDKMDAIKEAASAYLESDDFFEDEYRDWKALENDLKEQGYDYESILTLKQFYKMEYARVRKEESHIVKEINIAKSILQEIEKEEREKERNTAETKEQPKR